MSKILHYLITADAAWWDKLTKDEQKQYITEHPESKFAGHISGKDNTAKPPTVAAPSHSPIITKALKPGSKARDKAAAHVEKHAEAAADHIAKDPTKLKEAASIGREALKGNIKKPGLLYKLGSTLGYGLGAAASVGAASLSLLDLTAGSGSAYSGAALGLTAVTAAILYTKSLRRLLGYGGKYTDYDKQQHTASDSVDVDSMSDKQVMIELYKRMAEFIKSGHISPEDIAKYGKPTAKA